MIATDSFQEIDYQNEEILVDIASDDLEAAPSIEKNKSISQMMEEKIVDYFEWPLYWLDSDSFSVSDEQAGDLIRKKLYNHYDEFKYWHR